MKLDERQSGERAEIGRAAFGEPQTADRQAAQDMITDLDNALKGK